MIINRTEKWGKKYTNHSYNGVRTIFNSWLMIHGRSESLLSSNFYKNVQNVQNKLFSQKIVILTHFANSSVLSSPDLSVSHSKMIFFTWSGSLNFVFLCRETGSWPGGVLWASTIPKLKMHVIQKVARNNDFMLLAWELLWHCLLLVTILVFSFVSYWTSLLPQ